MTVDGIGEGGALHSVWRGAQYPILASKSIIRRELLERAGIPVIVDPPDFDERAFERQAFAHSVSPSERALLLARQKALLVSRKNPTQWTIGADQVLTCETTVLHKPDDRDAAHAQLAYLSGRTHSLHSAAAIAINGVVRFEICDRADLTMRSLDTAMLDRYLDLAGPAVFLSVGAYQLETLGVHLFEEIEGRFFTILGLPLEPLIAFFRAEGCLAL